ncbi:hypothetical protein ACRAWG_37040 [Methylobacterium sp. P31]
MPSLSSMPCAPAISHDSRPTCAAPACAEASLAARVAPLANAARVEVRLHPSEHTRQILFAGATTNVPLSESAAALLAWAICRLAGEQRAGLPEEARRTLLAVTRLIHAWPLPIAHRFEPRIDAL